MLALWAAGSGVRAGFWASGKGFFWLFFHWGVSGIAVAILCCWPPFGVILSFVGLLYLCAFFGQPPVALAALKFVFLNVCSFM